MAIPGGKLAPNWFGLVRVAVMEASAPIVGKRSAPERRAPARAISIRAAACSRVGALDRASAAMSWKAGSPVGNNAERAELVALSGAKAKASGRTGGVVSISGGGPATHAGNTSARAKGSARRIIGLLRHWQTAQNYRGVRG